jgi:hypothetical protein
MVVYTNQAQEAGRFGSRLPNRAPGREHLDEPGNRREAHAGQ